MKQDRGAPPMAAAAGEPRSISAAICGLSLAAVVVGIGGSSVDPTPGEVLDSRINKSERSNQFGRRLGVVWQQLRAIIGPIGNARTGKTDRLATVDKNRLADKEPASSEATHGKLSIFNYTDDLVPLSAALAGRHPNISFAPCFSSWRPNGRQAAGGADVRLATPSDLADVFGASFYWGAIDRHQAESVLEDKPEGTFLLRDSAHIKYLFSVSFRKYDRTLHARIELRDSRYSFDRADATVFAAPTMAELIHHYGDPNQCMYFEPHLSHPLNRNFTFSLAEICRATIVGCCADDGSADLPLPLHLRRFVREFRHKPPPTRSHSTG